MISSSHLAKTLLSMATEEKDSNVVLEKFFNFLEKNNLEGMLPQILFELERSSKAGEEQEAVHVKAAHKLSAQSENHIKKIIGAPENTPVRSTIDKDVLGGFTARYNGVEYEGSLERTVTNLERTLRKEA